MKSLLGKLGVILIGLIIFCYGEAWGEDWRLYSSTDASAGYYDAQSITHPSKSIVRVWEKNVYTEKAVKEAPAKFGSQYKDLSFLVSLAEINCIEKKSRCLSLNVYNNNGDLIDSSNSPSEWKFIIPGSMEEGLYNKVCK